MSDDLFASAGSLRERYEATDWGSTPFGPLAGWSPTLRSTVRLLLSTEFACTLLWGPEHAILYNEAYVDMIGDKHPSAIGSPARAVFAEAWPIVGPLMDRVTSTGEATWTRDALVPLERHGFVEDCWFTFSYSPVLNDEGEVEGILDIAAETTREVVARRRLEILARLRAALLETVLPEHDADRSVAEESIEEDVVARALEVLRESPLDLPAVDVRGGLLGRTSDDETLPDAPARPWDADADLVLERVDTPDGPRTVAWMPLPTASTAPSVLMLVARLSPALVVDEGYTSMLRLIASSVGQALDRARNLHAERLAARSEREFSEALQRSLLGSPLQADHIHLAVRYVPATRQDQIGGDWHDSFMSRDGALNLVVGDVMGHDRSAAVAMGQARNVLRGIGYALDRSPGATLEAFEHAVLGLDISTLITAVLARVEQPPELARTGRRVLRWSNAGHPPPLLVEADGSARYLEDGHGPLLGFNPGRPRPDATVDVGPGCTLVLFTDGLVERRGVHLDESLEELRRVVVGAAHLDAEQLADHLVRHAGDSLDDDVALTVARFLPEDGPRPGAASEVRSSR